MQRSVIQFNKANPLQTMTALEQAISLPHEYAPMRYPSFPALERTAVMSFNVPKALSFPTGATSMKGALFRQAAFPFWCEQTVSSFGQMTTYAALDYNGATNIGVSTPVTFLLSEPSSCSIGSRIASTTDVGMSGNMPQPWEHPLLGVHDTHAYTYVPAGSVYSFIFSVASKTSAANLACSLSYEVWTTKSAQVPLETTSVVITDTELGARSTQFTAAYNFWMRPISMCLRSTAAIAIGEAQVDVFVSSATSTFTPSTSTRGLVTLTSAPAILFVPFAGPPEFDVTERPWRDTRTTASALLLTNVTKVLNKEGTVLAGRLQNISDGAWTFTADTLAQLHPAEKAMLALETGFYTYCPPSTDLSSFYDHTYSNAVFAGSLFSSTQPTIPVFNLDNDSYANCFVLTDSDAATPSTFAANVDWHIEFRNNSTLFPIGMSGITLEAFHQAILNLVSHGFFFCNNKHKSALAKIFAAGRKVAPMAVGMLPPPARLAANLALKMGDRILSKRPNTTPPTTSAKGSGMTAPAKGGKTARKSKSKGKKRN
jgi:hypothetical protein